MFLIVGLGNPEPEYSMTRHNMGFDVINKIAKKYEIDISRSKFNGLYGILDLNILFIFFYNIVFQLLYHPFSHNFSVQN